MSFIQKGRILQTKIRVNREIKRQIKQHRYKLFLQNPKRHLPSYRTLNKWRTRLIVSGVVCLAIISIQGVFFRQTIYWSKPPMVHKYQEEHIPIEMYIKSFLQLLPFINGFLFMVFMYLATCFDWVIYRRWGHDRSIIHWGQKTRIDT